METFRFDSGSLDETEAFLSEAYTPMRIGGRPEDARARVVRREAGGLVSDRLEFGYTMAYDAGRLNRICLVTVHAGSLVDTTGGGERLFGPGETFLLAPPDRPYRGRVRSARYTITMFDPALLAEAAGTGGGFRGPVRLTGQRALDEAARHLAAVVLTALPSTVLDDGPAPLDGRDAHSDTLRRAMAFIQENAHRDIGLADIAAAVPVTPRAVQYAFARHAGTTPLAHLRRVRLARAHEELRAADAATTVVAAVAARWGFAHPGRFAAAHRREYGTSPSEVLRGGRRAGPAG
ncbi:helix-turn-helix transcriptional regulator [Streptomyces sp. NPDC058758]|uniref:helix-turn-helix transcriptional regulator n=1 Tax=Streptomyces sp. NPDC058758 TaxID=3346627 RepID=UPI0036B98C2A